MIFNFHLLIFKKVFISLRFITLKYFLYLKLTIVGILEYLNKFFSLFKIFGKLHSKFLIFYNVSLKNSRLF